MVFHFQKHQEVLNIFTYSLNGHYHMEKTWLNIVHEKRDGPVTSIILNHQSPNRWMISFRVITVANGGCMARPPEISLTHGFMHSVSALTQVTTFCCAGQKWYSKSHVTGRRRFHKSSKLHKERRIFFSRKAFLRKLMLDSPRERADWKLQKCFAA